MGIDSQCHSPFRVAEPFADRLDASAIGQQKGCMTMPETMGSGWWQSSGLDYPVKIPAQAVRINRITQLVSKHVTRLILVKATEFGLERPLFPSYAVK